MAFESVDVNSLKSALTQCRNSINFNTTNQLMNNISNSSVWQSDSQKNLKNAMSTLVNKRYAELIEKLNNYSNVVSYIEQYKSLESENASLERESNDLSRRLYRDETYEIKTSVKGRVKTETRVRTVKDSGVENSINNIRNRINNNNSKMETLKNKVYSSI